MSVPADLNLVGAIGDIPAASSAYNGKTYFATDEDGGTFYRCNGTTWVKVAAAVNEAAGATGVPVNGWVDAAEMTFVSVDDPTGVFDFTGDVRANYSAGMRIKFTNAAATIYGIITDVNQTLETGNTRITFLHQIDPADRLALVLMAESAITSPYYSSVKAPVGFPLDPNKWAVQGGSNSSQATPTVTTWYNVGGSVVMPIGAWKVDFMYQPNTKTSGSGQTDMSITLSTANNTVGIEPWNNEVYANPNHAENYGYPSMRTGFLSLSTKTTYYANAKWQWGGTITYIGLRFVVIRAVCAYL